MTAAKRRRGRPEAPLADLGPRQRLANGSAVLTYRADPANPAAPLIRAARAYLAWEWMDPPLSKPEQVAAAAIEAAAQRLAGSAAGEGGGGGRPFWMRSIPEARLADAQRLRELRLYAGRPREAAVLRLVVDGDDRDEALAREGLAIMVEVWRL